MANLESTACTIFKEPLSGLNAEQVDPNRVIDYFFKAIHDSPDLDTGTKFQAGLIARFLEVGQQSPDNLAKNLKNLWDKIDSKFTLEPTVDTTTNQLTGFSLNPIPGE